MFFAAMQCVFFCGPAQVLNLSDPCLNRQVDFSINGYEGSSHYITPLKIELKNNSAEPKTVKIDNGQMLIAKDSDYQNFIVTRDEMIELGPDEEKSVLLFAMCTERFDASPSGFVNYFPSPKTDSALKQLTTSIAEKKLFNYEAQTAVWALVGDYSLTDIVGFDTCLTRELTGLVAEIRGVDVPPPPGPEDYSRNYYTQRTTYKVTMSGKFYYSLYEEGEIIIAMFDKDNIVVRELYKNKECQPGEHNLEVSFDATEYNDEFYFVRILHDGEITIEMKMETPERVRQG